MFRLGPSDSLENVNLLWACEVHDDFAVVRSQTEGRVIFGLHRRRSFVNLAQTENVVNRSAEAETGEYFLLSGRSDLHKLAADFDDDLNLAFRLGHSSYWLKYVASVCDYTYGVFGKMKLAEVKMRLQIL